MADTDKQTPLAQSFCGSLRRDGHWKCLALTLMITGCLVTIFWCQFDNSEKAIRTYLDTSYSSSERSGPCKRGYIYIPVACVVMLYLVYLVECWHSHAWLELRYKCDIATVYSTVNKMQHALPVIWWKATCYHYVRRTRQVTRYRNGDAFTSTQVYYERVNSNTAGAAFNYTRCGVKDISRPLSDLEKYPAIKIKLSKGFSFANLDTEFEFEEQRSQFFQEYETKDDYMEGREGMDLINVDFKEYIIAFKDPNNLPWYVSHVVFWIASFVLLSWPLRAIIEFKTAHLHYHIHKLFGSNYLDSETYPGLISRVSTMNSSEFEMSIRNNNVIVPSYSEAMLAEVHDQLHRRDYGTMKTQPFKFPRSLTTITLAGRTSRRSATPAVTMNKVKKFKSCNVFGKSESTESALDAGTIRHQIQQLVRDRGRALGKRTTMSQYSISGLSIRNDNIRFQNISPDLPDVISVRPSSSLAPTRINENISEDATGSNSGIDEPWSESLCFQNVRVSNPKWFSGQLKARDSVLNRSKSVPGSARCGQGSLEHFPSVPGDGSSLESVSATVDLDLVQKTLPSLYPPAMSNANFVSVAASSKTSPTTPSSPPGYEDAIKMRHLVSSLVPNVDLNSLNYSSEIGLTENSSKVRTRSKMAVTGSRALHDGKDNANLVPDALIDPVINKRQSMNPSDFDISSSENSRLKSLTSSEGDNSHPCPPQQHHYHKHDQQRSTAKLLKALPKVSKINCPESEDSDIGCLHSTRSDMGGLNNAHSGVDCLSDRTSQLRSFGIGSISRLAAPLIAQDGTSDPLGSQSRRRDRGTPSTSVSTAVVEGCRVQAPSRHRMETSV